jgi:hypothetical protein
MTGTRAAYMRTHIKIQKHAGRARLIEIRGDLALPLRRMQSRERRCERQAASATAGSGSRTQ